MPTPTYDLIGSAVLSSNTREVTISSIPNTYRDLICIVTCNVTSPTDQLCMQFNGNESDYGTVTMEGTGTEALAGANNTNSKIQSSLRDYDLGSTNAVYVINIMEYSTTNKHKTVLIRGGASSQRAVGNGSRWANTSAINSIRFFTDSASKLYASGSTFYIYGIAA